jgi:hypothetical protein
VAGEDGQRTKVVSVTSKDKGGIGEAKVELGHFAASLAECTPTERPTVTVAEMLDGYVPQPTRSSTRWPGSGSHPARSSTST